MLLMAEDAVLLLTDDANGASIRVGRRLDLVLSAAVLLELAAHERVDVARPTDPARDGKILVRDARPVGDPDLDRALAALTEVGPCLPGVALHTSGRGVRSAMRTRLAGAGILTSVPSRRWGIIPTQRWPIVDPRPKAALLAELREVLELRRLPTDRERSLLTLLHAVAAVGRAVGEPGLRELSPQVLAIERRAEVVLAPRAATTLVLRPLDAMIDALGRQVRTATEAST